MHNSDGWRQSSVKYSLGFIFLDAITSNFIFPNAFKVKLAILFQISLKRISLFIDRSYIFIENFKLSVKNFEFSNLIWPCLPVQQVWLPSLAMLLAWPLTNSSYYRVCKRKKSFEVWVRRISIHLFGFSQINRKIKTHFWHLVVSHDPTCNETVTFCLLEWKSRIKSVYLRLKGRTKCNVTQITW